MSAAEPSARQRAESMADLWAADAAAAEARGEAGLAATCGYYAEAWQAWAGEYAQAERREAAS